MVDVPRMERTAVLVVPTQACIDWVDSCFPNDRRTTPKEDGREPTVYLIPENDANPDDNLRRHYQAILTTELELWCTDRSRWPKDLSFQTFTEFFTIHAAILVFDLGQTRLNPLVSG